MSMRSEGSAGCPARLMRLVCLARGPRARSASRVDRNRLARVTPELPGTQDPAPVRRTYSYLGPAGTFTEAALAQVPEARNQAWRSVRNVGEALADVVEGRSDAAMIAIENSIDGGVSTAQDA